MLSSSRLARTVVDALLGPPGEGRFLAVLKACRDAPHEVVIDALRRAAAHLPADAGWYLLALEVDRIAHDEIIAGVAPSELVTVWRDISALLGENDMDEEAVRRLPRWAELNSLYDELSDQHQAAVMRRYGLEDMAHLYLTDPEEWDARSTRGREAFLAE